MYLDYVVDIPDVKGKITFRTKGKARYVYYEYSREYDPTKQYTNVKRVTIGKVLPEDENKMRPNENFRRYFPEVEQPEEKTVSCRSSCLKTGAYMIIDKAAKDLELDTKLQDSFGAKAAGIMLDLAAYSIITEGNAAQYYPDYAYNHPLFTPDMKCYSDSFISDFLRSIKENQRQDFLDQWNADRCKRERIYISYDSTNKNCQAGDIDIVEFGAAKVDAGLPIFNYAVGERARLEEKIHEMQRFMEQHEDKEYEFGPAFHKYFHMHYNKENGHFVYGEPKLPVIQDELELCGYFAIISSEKMAAKDAINLYKSRDVSEKVFRADKSYLGNHCLRVASEEAASNKIFIGFLALIIRCRIYTALKEKAKGLAKKPNYLTVPAAIRELEKIELIRQSNWGYRMDYAVTATQKEILKAFNMTAANIRTQAAAMNEYLMQIEKEG